MLLYVFGEFRSHNIRGPTTKSVIFSRVHGKRLRISSLSTSYISSHGSPPTSSLLRAATQSEPAGEKESMRLAQLRYMDIPGCDPGHTKAGTRREDLLGQSPRRNARTTASAAYFYDKEGALCECYHSLGWSGTIQDARLIADNLIWAGIRYLVPHGLFYSTHALKKHDAPPTFFFQMPYWPLFHQLSDHVDSLLQAFANTWIDAHVLLVEPSAGMPTRHSGPRPQEKQGGVSKVFPKKYGPAR